MCKECGGYINVRGVREIVQLSYVSTTWRNKYCPDTCTCPICEHDRERSQCKEYGGSQICEHGKIRSNCKECYARKGSKDVGVAVLPDSVFIVDAADSAAEDASVFVAIS